MVSLLQTKGSGWQLSLNLLQMCKELDKQIQQALIDKRMAWQNYQASQKNVSMNEESFRSVRQKYDAGAVTFVDYQITLDNLIKAESQILQAKCEYLLRSVIVDFYQIG